MSATTINKNVQFIHTYLNQTQLKNIAPRDPKLIQTLTLSNQEEACRILLKDILSPYQTENLCCPLYQKINTASSSKNTLLALFHLCYHGLYHTVCEISQSIKDIIDNKHPLVSSLQNIKVIYLYTTVTFHLLRLNDLQHDTQIQFFPRISVSITEKQALKIRFKELEQSLLNYHCDNQKKLTKCINACNMSA